MIRLPAAGGVSGLKKPSKAGPGRKKAAQEKATPFDRRDFRRALGQFATGVTVVTAQAKSGRPMGLTVNSFASVSLDPPLLLVSVDRTHDMHAALAAAEHFVLNVLAADQEALSRRFAGDEENRFDGVGWPALAERVIERLARRPALADLLVGATGNFVPARAALRPGVLARLLF